MVIVKSGTASLYSADEPPCRPHEYETGGGFVDPGGDVHALRNEGSVELIGVVTSLVPVDAERRIDEPDPGNCAF